MKKIILTTVTVLILLVFCVPAFALSLEQVKRGNPEMFPKEDGYPNIETAFVNFFEKPKFYHEKKDGENEPYFSGICYVGGRKSLIKISFIESDAIEKPYESPPPRGFIDFFIVWINQEVVYNKVVDDFPSMSSLFGSNTMKANDLWAAIYLGD
jgi:hypothetical protein